LKFRCQVMGLKDTGTLFDLVETILKEEKDELENVMNILRQNRIRVGLQGSYIHAQLHSGLTAYRVAQFFAKEYYTQARDVHTDLIAPWSGRAREDGFYHANDELIEPTRSSIRKASVEIIHAHDEYTLPWVVSSCPAQSIFNTCRVRARTLLFLIIFVKFM